MQLEYLRSFLEVYRTSSLTQASRNLNLTQPAISNHIKSLESAIGKPLFQRVGRGVIPTPVADEIAHSISSPLESLEKTIGSLKKHNRDIEGTVYIAGTGEFIQFAATKIVSDLLPLDIRLRIRPGYRECIIEGLEKGEIDLAFLSDPFKPDIYDHKIITTESLIAVSSPEWAKKHFESCHKAETLIDKPVIAYDEELYLVNKFFKELLNKNYEKSPIVTVHDLRIVMEFVLKGHGFSVLPDYLCHKAFLKKKLVQLIDRENNPKNNIYLVCPKSKLRDSRIVFVKNYIEKNFEKYSKF